MKYSKQSKSNEANFSRTDRIAEMILRHLSTIIQQEITDPRLPNFVTISAVKVSKDLGHARVYFTALHDNSEQTAEILNTASGYLRSFLAKAITTYKVPQLYFVYDNSVEYGRRLSRLIDDVNEDD